MYQHQRIQEKLRFELGENILSALTDPDVIEIMLNEDGKVWLDTFSGMKCFCDLAPTKAHNMIRTIASIAGVEVNRDYPDIAGEVTILLDGELKLFRFQGLIPPVVSNPVFAIRKPASRVFTLKEYVNTQIITTAQHDYIETAINDRKNILVVGSTGSGKTTLCNAVLHGISEHSPDDRVMIIEDTIELQCDVENKVQLRTSETRSMDDLLRYCMRMRPDRIIVGEVRGKEAHSLIKAWNTGHPGGVCTVHANDALRGVLRIEQLVQEANVAVVPEAIAEAINVILFITRDSASKAGRKVQEVVEVQAYDKAAQRYIIEEVQKR